MIGIGISTYNRKHLLTSLIEKIRQTSFNFDLFVADDGSNDGTSLYLKEQGISHISGENVGIARNKNRILKHFKNYDFIFIIEDDVIISKSGWIETYIRAYEVSGINHFAFSPSYYYGKYQKVDDFGDIHIAHPLRDGGTVLFFTKKVIRECGGFDSRFIGYGWEHCEYTERIFKAGLSGEYKINHIIETEQYIKFLRNVPVANSSINRKQTGDLNKVYWEENRKNNIIFCSL